MQSPVLLSPRWHTPRSSSPLLASPTPPGPASVIDFQLEQWINAAAGASHPLDALMIALAKWSKPFFVILVLGWFGLGVVRHRRHERVTALAALLSSGLALAINQGIAPLWSRPRPFVAHPHAVRILLAHAADSSFPSDHVAAAVAISVVVWSVHRRLGVAALVLAAGVGYARVFVGDHYPGDVLGGAVVGVLSGAALAAPLISAPLVLLDRALVYRLQRTRQRQVDD